MQVYLQTERTVMREIVLKDADELLAICRQPSILKWLPQWNVSLTQLRNWIRKVNANPFQEGTGTGRMVQVICLKNEGTMIGLLAAERKPDVDNQLEIGYFLVEEYRGNGIMTEVLEAWISWMRERYWQGSFIALTDPDNEASQRLLHRIGFCRVSTIAVNREYDGRVVYDCFQLMLGRSLKKANAKSQGHQV